MKTNWTVQVSTLDHLVEAGVSKLRGYGFTNVTKDNILTDEVYLFFLLRFIETLRGKNKKLDEQIDCFCKAIQGEAK